MRTPTEFGRDSFFCTTYFGGTELVVIYLDVARFRLNSIDDDVFGAVNTDTGVVNNDFEGKNDAEDAVFDLTRNGI